MIASFSLWLLKSESNTSYSIMATVSSETESGSITDTEDSSSSFMEVTLFSLSHVSMTQLMYCTNCHSILNMGIAPSASHTIYESWLFWLSS
jgi:hypothetical protein